MNARPCGVLSPARETTWPMTPGCQPNPASMRRSFPLGTVSADFAEGYAESFGANLRRFVQYLHQITLTKGEATEASNRCLLTKHLADFCGYVSRVIYLYGLPRATTGIHGETVARQYRSRRCP
jgi:hypothetical protein